MKDQLRIDINVRDMLSGRVYKIHDEKLAEGIRKLMEWRNAKYGEQEADLPI